MFTQEHAADTYAEFAEQNRELLQTIPPPLVALNYYKVGKGMLLLEGVRQGCCLETFHCSVRPSTTARWGGSYQAPAWGGSGYQAPPCWDEQPSYLQGRGVQCAK